MSLCSVFQPTPLQMQERALLHYDKRRSAEEFQPTSFSDERKNIQRNSPARISTRLQPTSRRAREEPPRESPSRHQRHVSTSFLYVQRKNLYPAPAGQPVRPVSTRFLVGRKNRVPRHPAAPVSTRFLQLREEEPSDDVPNAEVNQFQPTSFSEGKSNARREMRARPRHLFQPAPPHWRKEELIASGSTCVIRSFNPLLSTTKGEYGKSTAGSTCRTVSTHSLVGKKN